MKKKEILSNFSLHFLDKNSGFRVKTNEILIKICEILQKKLFW